MLISYLVYLVRLVMTIAGNLLRKGLRTPPEYIVFTLYGPYPDLCPPPEGLLQRRMRPRVKSLQELAEEFRRVAGNPRVKGVVLQLGGLALPLSRAQALVQLIQDLQAQGKEVITWATSYDTRSYLVAAAGNRVLLQQGGIIYALGFAERHLYFKNALDWCGIELDVVQVSPYKSALERFTRAEMSDEVREMTTWLMDSYYGQYLRQVARGRGLEEAQVRALIEKTPLYGEQAVAAGAVDAVVNAEGLPAFLGSAAKPATLGSWEQWGWRFSRPLPALPGSYIALLRVQGNIVDGKSRRLPARPPLPVPFLFDEQTGDLTFVQQARQALRDRRARGVLLYIDSRGGSASASEAMTSSLQQLAARKPLVALMGQIAGSGGYYVATPAAHIVARPATITGSIGVIAAKVVNSRLLERLLLNRETLQRGQADLFFSPEAPFSPQEREKAWEFIRHVYDLFIQRVAQGRALEAAAVEQIGAGKVWTGEQALEHGLVDELGGLETALAQVRNLAGLPPQTPLVDMPFPRRDVAPPPSGVGWLPYALDSLARLGGGRALLADPLFFHDLDPWPGEEA